VIAQFVPMAAARVCGEGGPFTVAPATADRQTGVIHDIDSSALRDWNFYRDAHGQGVRTGLARLLL